MYSYIHPGCTGSGVINFASFLVIVFGFLVLQDFAPSFTKININVYEMENKTCYTDVHRNGPLSVAGFVCLKCAPPAAIHPFQNTTASEWM